MKRLLIILLALLLPAMAMADPLLLGDPMSETVFWPEGAEGGEAVYTYTYTYPHVEGDGKVEEMINEYYAYAAGDAIAFTVPILGESLSDPTQPASTTVTATVTCNDNRFFSVMVVTESIMDGYDTVIYSGQTFPREGAKAGTVTSLPFILGALKADETDEWLLERQANKASTCVCAMIWEQLETMIASGTRAFYEDVDYELLCDVFYPEDDFFMNEDGDLVFFIEPGMLSDAADGVILITLSVDDILDEL